MKTNMKLPIYQILGMGLLAGLMASCQNDELAGTSGEGYIQLSSVKIDKNVITKAGETEIIAVDILNADGSTFRHADDWTTLQGEAFLVPAGTTYTVKAYSNGKEEAQGFDAEPVYAGEKQVTVEAGVNQTVDLTCKLAQSMVSVSYSDKFKKYFTDYTSVVTGAEENLALTFGADETRAAYVLAGQSLNISLTLTPQGGTEQEFSQSITDEAVAATHYKVNYDVNTEGSGNLQVTVNQNRHEYEITLGIPLTPDGVSTTAIGADPSKVWGQFAILEGNCSFVEPADPVQFQYKKASDNDWTTVAAEQVDGTDRYTAKVTALDFGTEYQYKIVCGTHEGEQLSFITEPFQEIPNLNFDTWTQSGKNWYANDEASNSYWATGNEGVTMWPLPNKDATTVPVDEPDAKKGKAAKMTSLTDIIYVGAAAGNLFIGSYETNASNPSASVSFGRDYTGARPVKLSGWYKYDPKAINHGSYPGGLINDECNIYVTVWDADGNQIGFGEFVGKEKVDTYQPFSFDIEYSDPTKKAAKLTIVATSSHYGGHFEGSSVTGQVGNGSTLWVDDFELSYY